MLSNLQAAIESFEFDNSSGTINLVGARLDEGDLILSLSFDTNNVEAAQRWETDCINLLEYNLILGDCEDFEVQADHVLLWPHTHSQASVSFYGNTDSPLAVVGALWQRHQELVGSWIPFDRFTNGNVATLIEGRYGMLADGPMPLVEAYAQVLESFALDARVTAPRPAYFNEIMLSRVAGATVLTFENGAYAVAQRFGARRLS